MPGYGAVYWGSLDEAQRNPGGMQAAPMLRVGVAWMKRSGIREACHARRADVACRGSLDEAQRNPGGMQGAPM